jgi:hypothetical protein
LQPAVRDRHDVHRRGLHLTTGNTGVRPQAFTAALRSADRSSRCDKIFQNRLPATRPT